MVLSRLVTGRSETEPVFLGRRNERMTRFGIHRLVAHYARLASKSTPSLSIKRVSPHTIRHTTVDINTIRAWLGHVSLDTTHVYAEVDMEMKATALARVDTTALARVDIKGLPQTPPGRTQMPSLMAFLRGL